MRNRIHIMLMLVFALFIGKINAQRIQLLDFSNQTPIAGANFTYGESQGSSDQQGYILIDFKENTVLELSHLNYGTWKLQPLEVKNALQQGISFKDEISYSLKPVTVVALHTPVNSRSILSLSSRDKLAHDGGDLLNNIEGFSSVRKSGAYGFDPVFRGFKYDQLNVVIDGIQSASAACPNRMDPPTSQVAPNMISHIEVLKGPHSLRFGNAFGASINYVTSAPRFNEEKKIYTRLTSSYETNGSVTRNEGSFGLNRKKYDFRLFGSLSRGSDYKDGENIEVPADFMRASIGVNLGVKISGNQNVVINATRNIARDTDFPSLPMDLRSDDTWLLMVKHEYNPLGGRMKSWSSSAFGTWVDHKMDNLLKTINPRTMNASTPAKTSTYGVRTEGIWQKDRSKLFLGADFKTDNSDGTRERAFLAGPNAGKVFYDNVWQNGTISKSALFAEYQFSLQEATLIFAGRLEFNMAKIGDLAPEFGINYHKTKSSDINPSFSVGTIWHAGKSISAGFWLGHARRSGSLTERFINYLPVGQDAYELLGNPAIKPETNNEADFNLSLKTENTSFAFDMFASLIQNCITSVKDSTLTPKFPSSPGVRQFRNLEEAMKAGFELSWKQRLTSYLNHRLAIAYTYGQDLTEKEPLPEIAPLELRYSLNGRFLGDKLQPGLNVRHALKQERISSGYGETETPDFTLIDLIVNYQITKRLASTVGVLNLLNEAYFEHLSRTIGGTMPREIYAPGRNFFISLTFEIQ